MADLTILDRPLNKTKASEVSFSALAQIFSGYISSSKEIVTDISELEAKYSWLVLICFILLGYMKSGSLSDWNYTNWIFGETKLQKKNHSYWMFCSMSQIHFGSSCADILQTLLSEAQRTKMNVSHTRISTILIFDLDMIFDNDPLISKFIAPPRDLASLNCSIFYGGMIGAILFSNGFVNIKIFI